MECLKVPVNLYPLRRTADKARRRLRVLAGKPDNTPWLLSPKPLSARPAYADFIFTLDYLSTNSKLLRMMHEAMSAYGLSVLLVNESNVASVTRDVQRGAFAHTFTWTSARPGDVYEQLLYSAANAGVRTIRNPDHTKWVLKADLHLALEQAGFPLPPTVILRADEPDRDLTPEERQRLGDVVAIKPSFGEAGKGVRLNREPSLEVISKARDFNRKDDWLIQKMMRWTRAGERPAYVRAYNVLGHRSMLWWSGERGGYECLSWEEFEKYDLFPAMRLVDRLAELNGMEFFSSEICAVADSGPDRFCLIDYTNDQCDIDPESSPSASPPQVWAQWVCRRFAEFTWRIKHGLDPMPDKSFYLAPPPDTSRASA